MKIIKLICYGALSSCLLLALSACYAGSGKSSETSSAVSYKDSVEASMKKYPVCNVSQLAEALRSGNNVLGKKMEVHFHEEKESGHPYYMVIHRGAFNADKVRRAVCGYVLKHNCRVYWGNVANIAMFAKRRAAKYPADTSPHYMISPDITCNKAMTKHS